MKPMSLLPDGNDKDMVRSQAQPADQRYRSLPVADLPFPTLPRQGLSPADVRSQAERGIDCA